MRETNQASREGYLEKIENAKELLKSYFLEHYVSNNPSPVLNPSPAKTSSIKHFDFFSLDNNTEMPLAHELDDYLALKPLGFKPTANGQGASISPLQWWRAKAHECPNLSRLARDILSIPGSAVAVERVFCGGCDTISLCRANLKPETIRKLMLVKHKALLARRIIARESHVLRQELHASEMFFS